MLKENRHVILAIDDDEDILRVLKANIELHKLRVITANSWTEGQKAMTANKPDLILLDIMLPDGDGVEICRSLRAEHMTIPIIMLTAKDKISDKVIGLDSGADDYMVKPFETLELIARIKACLRRTKPAATEDKVIIKDMHINYKKRTVAIKKREIILTPKEYNLLCLLVSNRGYVVSREEIKKHLWKNTEIYAWSRVIDVHIQHLRQKIEKNLSEPEYILTVSGIGYKFVE